MPPPSDADLLDADRPIQFQIYRRLRAEILDGLWIDRDDFPGERELAERFEVSVITSRAALDRLAREDLVQRRRGRGTRATHVPPQPGSADSPPLFPPQGPLDLEFSLVRSGIDIAPVDACRALGVPPGSRLWQAVRLAWVGGQVYGVFQNVQLPETGLRHRPEDLASEPMVTILESEGVPLATVRRTIAATPAPADAARHLEVPLDSPVLLIVLRAQSADGTTIEWTRMLTRPDQPLHEEVLDLATGHWSTSPG